MMDGLHTFIESKARAGRQKRLRHWQAIPLRRQTYEKSVHATPPAVAAGARVVDPVSAVADGTFGDDDHPALVAEPNTTGLIRVPLALTRGVWGEGLLLELTGKPPPHALVALTDADQTPEQGRVWRPGWRKKGVARRLAENGFHGCVPVLLTDRALSGD